MIDELIKKAQDKGYIEGKKDDPVVVPEDVPIWVNEARNDSMYSKITYDSKLQKNMKALVDDAEIKRKLQSKINALEKQMTDEITKQLYFQPESTKPLTLKELEQKEHEILKCKEDGCRNRRDQGAFEGDYCMPCHNESPHSTRTRNKELAKYFDMLNKVK